jgi:regulatory protein
VPRITALRTSGRRSVAVELDGSRWRTLPLEAVVRAGLVAGSELERPQARVLARERRRLAALDAAVEAVRRRDRSEQDVRARLARRGVPAAERERALGTLRTAGVLDDGRYASVRAEGLARKGYGDAAIRHDLEQSGVVAERIEAALAALPPESERAAELVRRLGGGVRAARGLARRGFGEEAVEALIAAAEETELGW